MFFGRRLAKLALYLAVTILVVAATVLAVFKGGKIADFLTPIAPMENIEVNTSTLQTVKVYHNEGAQEGLAILVSDRSRPKETTALIKALVAQDIIVMEVDFNTLRQQRAAKPDSVWCHYYSDDLKDAAEAVQRSLHIKKYFFPVVIGVGDAAPFAYAVVAQAPRNTLAGAVSVGFSHILKSDRPFCPGALMLPTTLAKTAPQNRTYLIGNDKQLPAPWYVIAPPSEQAKVDEFQAPLDKAVSNNAKDEAARRKNIVSAVQELQRQEEKGISSLPVALIRPEGPARAVVVIVSGDGGWRDIDQQIGAHLASKGIAVVGLDALRYFWTVREPATIATDIELLLTEYGKEFKTETYGIAGYSFGANVIPFAWPLMTRPTRKKVKLISLLGLAPKTDFEISVEGYLGSNLDNAESVKPLLERLPITKTQCFYGEEELQDDSTACIFPEFDKAERVKMKGGHHFNREYDAIAETIAARILSQ